MMQAQTQEHVPLHELHSPATTDRQRRSRRGWIAGIVGLLLFAGLLVSGILQRVHTNASLRAETADLAIPNVSVVAPKRAAPSQEIVLPGNVQPFISSPIFARTNGYLEHWYLDIGAHVKKSQLLAVISSPEVDQQFKQAKSNLLSAQANLELAA